MNNTFSWCYYIRRIILRTNPKIHKDKHPWTMNLKPLHDFIGLCYGTNVIDDLEFILIYNYSQSREIWSPVCYWFRFAERNIPRSSNAVPLKTFCCQETVANNIYPLRILLKRLSYPCCLSDVIPLFGRNPTKIFDIFLHTQLYLQQNYPPL